MDPETAVMAENTSEILKLECLVLVVEDIQTWQGMNPETAAMAEKSLKY